MIKKSYRRKSLQKFLKKYPEYNFKLIDYVENSFYIERKHFILDKLYSDRELSERTIHLDGSFTHV